jgi:hypothetical protein
MKSMGMAEITVAGSVVPNSLKVLTTYAATFGATLRRYDFRSRGNPDVLTGEEIWTTRIIRSRVTHFEKSELERTSAGWTSLWAAIPLHASIEHADPAVAGGLYDDMDKLFGLITEVPGVSWAKASKILHFKRPSLYPILDSRLIEKYQEPAALAAADYPSRGFNSMYWAAIRNDVIANKSALRELRRGLASGDAELAKLATLSDLRLLDILGWSR